MLQCFFESLENVDFSFSNMKSTCLKSSAKTLQYQLEISTMKTEENAPVTVPFSLFIVNFEHYIVFDVDLELCDERWLVKDDFLKKCEKQVQRGVFILTKLLQLMVIETLLEQFWVNTYICVNLMFK